MIPIYTLKSGSVLVLSAIAAVTRIEAVKQKGKKTARFEVHMLNSTKFVVEGNAAAVKARRQSLLLALSR